MHSKTQVANLATAVHALLAWWQAPVRSMLEVGAGRGHWSSWYRTHHPRVKVVSTDISAHACEKYGHEQRDISRWRHIASLISSPVSECCSISTMMELYGLSTTWHVPLAPPCTSRLPRGSTWRISLIGGQPTLMSTCAQGRGIASTSLGTSTRLALVCGCDMTAGSCSMNSSSIHGPGDHVAD